MGEAKRVNPRIVDQDIDVALAKLDRAPRDLARARGITKIGRNKIRMPARRAYFPTWPVCWLRRDLCRLYLR